MKTKELSNEVSRLVRARVVGNAVYLEYPESDRLVVWGEVSRERAVWVVERINEALDYARGRG